MGQYYIAINVDKKEYIHPHRYDNGLKLMEWSYIGNHFANALLNLIAHRWKGDRVYVVGDYADLSDESEVWYPELENLTEELGLHDGDYKNFPDDYSLYTYAQAHYKHLPKSKVGHKKLAGRYIYNTLDKTYIDLQHVPVFHYDGWKWRVSPWSLLLAMGNGRGGGDYRDHNKNKVGQWAGESQYLEITSEPRPDHDQYIEWRPDFAEKW